MDLEKVIKILSQAENELMAQIGSNELDYYSLHELMNLAEQISNIADELYQYTDYDDGGEQADEWRQ